MFVRKKRNKSGTVSVQIVSKNRGKYRVIQTVGSAKDPEEVERLIQRGRLLAQDSLGKQERLFGVKTVEEHAIENFLHGLKNAQIHTIGPELIFGTIFDRIGFNTIKEGLFRHLVVARLAYPTSKLKTVDYLYRYRGIHLSEDAVYKFLDKLNQKYKTTVERIAYEHTKQTLGGTIAIIFYDMTTLYFEAEDEDDLRKIGFSKDGKFQHPQIMLGLLVGKGGLPIGYDIFEGNTFEGHTLLPTLEKIQEKYGFGKPIVVADAALLSKKNLEKLAEARYRFIIGARIKNEMDEIKEAIFKQAKGIKDKESFVIKKQDGTRLTVTYTDKRARKDRYNREKGLKKLRARVTSGKLTKKHINNRGYNKFLILDGDVTITLDEAKIEADKLWDGLKGYVTNTRLSPKIVVENYSHLWQIERAFRISKTDLRIRPIHHYRKRRIEAHILIAFIAYTIYKELERLLAKRNVEISGRRAAELTHNMYQLEYTLPRSSNTENIILRMDKDQQLLYDVIHRIQF